MKTHNLYPQEFTVCAVLTATEFKNIKGTALSMVPAPGVGKLLLPISFGVVIKVGSEAFTFPNNATTDKALLAYTGGLTVQSAYLGNVIDQVDNDAMAMFSDIEIGGQLPVNQGLKFTKTGTGEFSGNVSDDAVINVYLTYRVLRVF